ncbi:MAG: paraquat-inducible protein A [Alphaproteobacteria bacterium]|nr:paraquat-inducible protein A [Alphaproteobacteria bacterium]MBV9153281.1 paraquat-inducible protein A [Alphaproteobacteria bacterium]MBV9587936.1 paraquat-inducible protein A [Alphaproteobacteria bacterium]MBV9966981.1 paraquat-inducible protein A [Alphaproteobacteria bacterium]
MSDTLLACRDCGQLHHAEDTLVPGHRLACSRCASNLSRYPPTGLEVPLAFATTALILFLLANAYPIFVVNLEGRPGQDLLISGPLRLAEYGGPFAGLGMLVAGVSFVVPLIWLSLVVIVLAGLKWGDPALRPKLAGLWKTALLLYPWSMLDVYLLGTYVAFTRLSDAVDTSVAAGGFALGALVLTQALLVLGLGRKRVWDMIADPQPFAPEPGEPWVACEMCQLVTAAPGRTSGGKRLCPRCATPLEARVRGSLGATLALTIAAAILYLPANLLPVMTVERFGRVNTYTIMGGVEELVHLGMWPLALLVFFASIVVPMAKLLSLGWFLHAIRRRSARWLRERTRLYRLIDFVGRWSNIDVFMVSILAASLQFGFLTTVDPEAGIVSFAAVVALTMLATAIFDPRLMWDAAAEEAR